MENNIFQRTRSKTQSLEKPETEKPAKHAEPPAHTQPLSKKQAKIMQKNAEIEMKLEKNGPQGKSPQSENQSQSAQSVSEASEQLLLSEIQHNKDDFICGICLNYIQNAVSTNCGHSFCESCLSEYLIYYPNCLCCKKNLRKHKFRYSILLDQMIDAFIKQNHPEEYESYQQRKLLNKANKQNHQIKKFEVGSLIDVRDPSFIWCVGMVNKIIYKGQGRPKCIVVHYQDNYDCYDEEIIENSQRFAHHGSYTSRKDIPHYIKQDNLFLRKFPQVEIDCQSSEDPPDPAQHKQSSQEKAPGSSTRVKTKRYYVAQSQNLSDD